MLGGEDTHPWSASNVGNPILATTPVDNQQTTHTSHYTSRPKTKQNNQQTTQTSHYAVDW